MNWSVECWGRNETLLHQAQYQTDRKSIRHERDACVNKWDTKQVFFSQFYRWGIKAESNKSIFLSACRVFTGETRIKPQIFIYCPIPFLLRELIKVEGKPTCHALPYGRGKLAPSLWKTLHWHAQKFTPDKH